MHRDFFSIGSPRAGHLQFQVASLLGVMVICISAGTGLIYAQKAGHKPGSDTGATDDVSLFLNVVADLSDTLNLETTAAKMTALEGRIRANRAIGLISKEKAAGELFALGVAYWKQADYNTEFRLLQEVTDLAPDSYAAAQAWMLIGNTYYGNKADPEGSIDSFQEADRILQKLLASGDIKSQASIRSAYESRAVIQGRLGFAMRYIGREAEAEQYYKSLIETPELRNAVGSSTLVNAYRWLGEQAAGSGDAENARVYYTALKGVLDSGSLPLRTEISIRMEIIHKTYPQPTDPHRAKALGELWENERLRKDPAILKVGDELNLIYYFATPMNEDGFLKTSSEYVKRLHRFIDEDQEFDKDVENSIVRTALMVVEYAKYPGEPKLVQGVRAEFERRFDGREVVLSAPTFGDRSRARKLLTRFSEIYARQFPAHRMEIERLRELDRQKFESVAPRSSP